MTEENYEGRLIRVYVKRIRDSGWRANFLIYSRGSGGFLIPLRTGESEIYPSQIEAEHQGMRLARSVIDEA